MELVSLVILTVSLTPSIGAQKSLLFGGYPGGGLWASDVDETDGSSEIDTKLTYRVNDFNVESSSYDDLQGQVMMEVTDKTSRVRDIVYGPICSGLPKKTRVLFHLDQFSPIRERGLYCPQCEVTAFALFDSNVYFVLTGQFIDDYGNITAMAQLRALTSCTDCIKYYVNHQNNFNHTSLISCSKPIKTIISTPLSQSEAPYYILKAAKGLKVIQEGNERSFFFQLFMGRRNGHHGNRVLMTFVRVTSSGEMDLLNREHVDVRIAQYSVRGVGSVDYNDGVLCWTCGDRLYCGDFKEGKVLNKRMLLFPAEGAASGVCVGENYELLGTISGVAIGSVRGTRNIYFGCYPQFPEVGGTGLIRTNANFSNKEIYVIRQDMNRLLGGSLFHVESLKEECSFSPKPVYCRKLPDMTGFLSIRDASMLGTLRPDEVKKSVSPCISGERLLMFVTLCILLIIV